MVTNSEGLVFSGLADENEGENNFFTGPFPSCSQVTIWYIISISPAKTNNHTSLTMPEDIDHNFTFFWLKKRHSSTQKCTGDISKHYIGDNMKQLTSTRLALKVALFKLNFFWFKVSWLSSRYIHNSPT